MAENENHQEVITVEQIDMSMLEAQDKALIDKQIATAKQYPRNLGIVKNNIVALAIMDEETAKSIGYALPRQGKTIFGPTVHLARIALQQYGNIRVDTRIARVENKVIIGQATCIDLENNVGIRVEVSRRITNKDGFRYNDDMINMTGNAAIAIALRNAAFSVIPKPLIDAGYKAAQHFLIGDISDETKLIKKRKSALDHFLNEHGVNEADVLKALGVTSINQIKGDQLKTLYGMAQAINDQITTVKETFYPDKVKANDVPKVDLEQLQGLYDLKKDFLTPDEVKNADRILSMKEANSYDKLHALLKEK